MIVYHTQYVMIGYWILVATSSRTLRIRSIGAIARSSAYELRCSREPLFRTKVPYAMVDDHVHVYPTMPNHYS